MRRDSVSLHRGRDHGRRRDGHGCGRYFILVVCDGLFTRERCKSVRAVILTLRLDLLLPT